MDNIIAIWNNKMLYEKNGILHFKFNLSDEYFVSDKYKMNIHDAIYDDKKVFIIAHIPDKNVYVFLYNGVMYYDNSSKIKIKESNNLYENYYQLEFYESIL